MAGVRSAGQVPGSLVGTLACVSRSVIVAAVRTPFGRLGGGLALVPGDRARLDRDPRGARARRASSRSEVEYVIMGQVLQAGAGQAPARQAAVGAGIPKEVPADTINKVCASSIRALEIADLMIRAGGHELVVTGGMESMSNAPYLLPKARFGYRLGNGEVVDHMVFDGLTSTFDGLHMVQQASLVSRELGITREEQDEWALRSHQRAAAAQDAGRFDDEIVPVGEVTADEGVRRDTTLEKLAALQPVFDPEGTTTAGNAPGVNDGASCVIVCSEEFAERKGLEPLATILVAGLRRRRLRVPRADAGRGRRAGAREGGQDDRRRLARRDQRGVLLGREELDPDARRGRGDRERQRRRGGARSPHRRVRRPDRRDDGARSPAVGRRPRARGDLLRRRVRATRC